MRKLYKVLAGFFLVVCAGTLQANPVTPDIANFSFSIDHPNKNVSFTNTSVLGNEPGVRRAFWSFGDGTGQWTGPLQGTQHQYQSAGTYNVCLKIFRIRPGRRDSVLSAQICKTIVINTLCRADFERLNTSPNPLHVSFKALTWNNAGKKPVLVCWSFGDGQDTCIQYAITHSGPYSVQHNYAQPGNYNVCVRIVYQGGCEARKCKPVQLGPPDRCRASWQQVPTPNNGPLNVMLKAQPWHNHNKKPLRICWNFGDGQDTCIQYPNNYSGLYTVPHHYNRPGQYRVCVRISYQGGCEARSCDMLRIQRPDSCRADYVKLPLVVGANPLQAHFKALPWHNNNKKVKKICWTFGDGEDTCINYPANYNGLYTVPHRYQQPGQYEVCVNIFYQGDCESRKCKPQMIGNPPSCRAGFEQIPNTGANPLQVSFKALPWSINNQKPSRICWRFGDGQDTCINYPATHTGPYTVNHRYLQPGQYEVCVRIIYFGGCEARFCKQVPVGRPDSCRADFERLPITQNHPLQAGFRALPWHNNGKKPSRVCWRFGDGEDTCINYPANYNGDYVVAHRYSHPGQYEVCVKIDYYGGCDARKCKEIMVPPPPPVHCNVRLLEISQSVTSLTRGLLALPESTPARRPVRICWYFGDGDDTCIVIDPNQPLPNFYIRHTYPGPGVYRACVKIRFEGGCIAEDCKQIVIRPVSNVCGGFMADSLMGPRTFRFRGHSIHAPNDQVLSYRWTFGDGSTAYGQEVTHTWQQPGNYEVCLQIKTRLGCETRICRPLRVPIHHHPVLNLTPNPVISILHAAFMSTHTEPVNIRIVNNTGNTVRQYARNANTGPNNWDFDLSNLVPGLYSFVLQSPNQFASAMFIKQ